MHKLIIDLEFTHYKNKETNQNISEIIEIGAVLLDEYNHEIKKIKTYVKPTQSIIKQNIEKLTGITNEMVKDAPVIEDALLYLIDELPDKEYTKLISWSDNDTKTILNEMKIKSIHNQDIENLCNEFIDLQDIFNNKINLERRVSLSNALKYIDIEFEGYEHDALFDAENTAKLYIAMEDDKKVQDIIHKISELFNQKSLTTTLGNMFDFTQFIQEE